MGLLSIVAAAAAAPFTLYSSLPLTGQQRAASQNMVNAIKLAVADHGDMAGGHPIRYVSLDDATARQGSWDAGQTKANARKAALDNETVAYIGEVNSGASANSIPTLNQAGILQVSPTNTARGLTTDGPGAEAGEPDKYYPTGTRTFARVSPIDSKEADAQIKLMRAAGVKRLYVLDDEEVYGSGVAAFVRRKANAENLKVVGSASWDGKRAGYGALGAKIKAARPDAIFAGGVVANNAGKLLTDISAAVPGARLYGPDGLSFDRGFIKALPGAVQSRLTLTSPAVEPQGLPKSGRAFYAHYAATYKVAPETIDPYAVYGYAAADGVLDAIDAAGTAEKDIEAVRTGALKAFFGFRHHASVLGPFSINSHGDTTLTLFGVYMVQGGKLVYTRTVR